MSIFERFTNKSQDPSKQRDHQVAKLAPQLMANVKEDLLRFPSHGPAIEAFAANLKAFLKNPKKGQSDDPSGVVAASAQFFITEDRMDAYACLLPPINGGGELSLEALGEDMRYEGITSGVLEELTQEFVTKKKYLHIFPVAKGTLPVDGADGIITDCFHRQGVMEVKAEPGQTVDFAKENLMQIVRKGEIICRVKPPTPGQNGVDVTGKSLPCHQGETCTIPAGENTRISQDGLLLLADLDGVVYVERDKFCVNKQRIIPGDAELKDGPIRVEGDIYIEGDVLEGAVVEATGNVVIGGQIIDARVESKKGSVRAQKGIQGKKGTVVQAADQVQAMAIEGASVTAGGDVFAEVIANSRVTCGGTVNVLGGRGLILGGQVKARNLIQCKRIGNKSGQRTQVSVGGSPGLLNEMETAKTQMEEIKTTLEKLRKSVQGLRAAGELLSLEKRAVLTQLTEQRDLYEEKETALNGKMKQLKKALHEATSGKILCQELYPLTLIQIGVYEMECKTMENNCNIHVYAGKVVTK